jgi:hypothetical protein
MKLKLIYTLFLSFCYFSIIANGDDLPKIEEHPDFKKSLRTLFERAKASINQPQDYLLDMGTVSTLAPTDLKDLAVNGATSMLDQPTKDLIVAQLDAFNKPTIRTPLPVVPGGWGGDNGTKMFAFTGKILLGYSNVREFDYAGASNTTSDATKDTELMSALTAGLTIDNVNTPIYKKTFIQTIDSEWQGFKTTNTTGKTIVCFFVEAVLIRAKVVGGQEEVTRNQQYKPGSEINKSYFVLIWEDGLDAFDWYKVNNEESKTLLKMTYDPQNGFTQKAEFPSFIEKVHNLLKADLILDTPEKVIKFVQKTYSQKALLEALPFAKRSTLLTTIDKATELLDCSQPNEVSEKCGENAVLKLFETTPLSQYGNMLSLLKAISPNNPEEILLVSLSRKLDDTGIGANNYGNLIAYVNNFAINDYLSRNSTITLAEDNFVKLNDVSTLSFGDHLNTVTLDKKTGRINLTRKMFLYEYDEAYSGSSTSVSVSSGVIKRNKTENLKPVDYDPFAVIFITNQTHLSTISEGGIANTIEGTFEGKTYTGGLATAFSLTYIEKKKENQAIKNGIVLLGSAISIATGPGAITAALAEANSLKAGYVAFEMATAVGNITEVAGGIDPQSPAGQALTAANTVCLMYGAYKAVGGVAQRVSSLSDAVQNTKTTIQNFSLPQKINGLKTYITNFDKAKATLQANAIYSKLEGFRDMSFRVLKAIGEEYKTSPSNLKNIKNIYFQTPITLVVDLVVNAGQEAVKLTRAVSNGTSKALAKEAILCEYTGGSTFLINPTTPAILVDGYDATAITNFFATGGDDAVMLFNRNTDWSKVILGDEVYQINGATIPATLPSTVGLPTGNIVQFVNKKVNPIAVITVFLPKVAGTAAILLQSNETGLKELEKQKELENCELCNTARKAFCPSAEILWTKVGKTIANKSAINLICNAAPSGNVTGIFSKLTLTDTPITQKFLDDVNITTSETEHLANNIKSLNTSLLDNWIYLYSNHSTNAIFTRKDINALTKWNYINTDTKNSIINFSDNTSTSTPTFKTFMKDLDANKVGTANDNFNLFMDGFPEITEGFVGHKLVQANKTEDEYKEFYDEKKEMVEDLPLEDAVRTKAKKWLDYSEGNAKRKGYYQQGIDFEKWIGKELKNENSNVYLALRNKLGMNSDGVTYDLDQRSIYTQVRFCISGNVPCDQKNQYFIADFVFAKFIEDPITLIKKVDIIIADTKLSMNTNFTGNQNLAQDASRPTYFIWTNKGPIKGNSVNGFAPSQLVTRNTSFMPFFKIYRGNAPETLGGIKP